MAPTFLRRWVAIVTVGESLRFALPAAVGALLLDKARAVFAPALLAAGLV